MKNTTKFIGLDVSKNKIAVGIADEGREAPRFWGTISHDENAVRKLINTLRTEGIHLEICYEAGPTGYELYRWLLKLNVKCIVVAPTLIPKRSGDRVKTDKRDALRLAQLFRAGELTSVYVPTPEDESLRDMVRAREDAIEDLNRHKQRLTKLLLRRQMKEPKTGRWTYAYEEWLDTLKFENECDQLTFAEYRQSILETKERIKRYDQAIEGHSSTCSQALLIEALQALRGVAVLSATTIACELGNVMRFQHPKYAMSYAGLVPKESSSGESRWQGGITKVGNSHLRRIPVEAAWSYRYSPAVKKKMRQRIEGLPAEVQMIAWKAQHRLHKKFRSMLKKGKHKGTITAAIARELIGFVWAIAKVVEQQRCAA